MKKGIFAALIAALLTFIPAAHGEAAGYVSIPQDEAYTQMHEEGAEFILLDVRTQEEYDEAHIPGAVCLPNETITSEPPELLPDKDAVIYVYCRSGRRSKQAAEKLAAMGYTHVVEFGGLLTWPYETVSTEEENP
jgi:Rhodanese-related sulfurtransferase